jgi:hypothetical protein
MGLSAPGAGGFDCATAVVAISAANIKIVHARVTITFSLWIEVRPSLVGL